MTKLYDYQVSYLEGLQKNCIFACDVGLGKTIMALEHARRHCLKNLVVVAPASKVRTGDWQREIETFFDSYKKCTSCKNFIEVHAEGWSYEHTTDGTMLGNICKSNGTWDVMPIDYTVISYEMFSKRASEFVSEHTTLIIDESHMACNATTRRAKSILKVAQVAHQWIMLSATPLPNGWKSAETYAILTGLANNKTEFVNRFEIINRDRGFPLLLGYREQSVLESWWASIAKPLKRTGAQHLPSQSIPLTMAMTPSIARTYAKALKERIYGEELLDNPSKLFTTLRQIPTPARVEALHSVLDSTDEHIVVFYNYNSERDAILELLNKSFKERTIYEQSGHRSHLPTREKWAELKPSVTLAQYQSASQAIELTYASVTVYFSPCTSFANYEQSKGRTRRNGQDKTTLFYHLAVEGSLDKHIWGLIKQKRDFSLEMFNNVIA